jgi:anti-sigma regulatory factor (Ser/Thr protein kinase)
MNHLLACRDTRAVLCETWPGEPENGMAARHWLRSKLTGVEPHVAHLVETAAGELISNAIRHTLSGPRLDGTVGEFEVALKVFGTCVIVAVTDQGADTVPIARDLDPLEAAQMESGRGLWLVSQMAREWRHRPVGSGRQTWAAISRRRS